MNTILAVLLTPIALFAISIMLGAFFLVKSRRTQRLWAMVNQVYTGTPTSRRQLTLPNVSAFTSASGVIGVIGAVIDGVGGTPFVTLDTYQSNFGGCTCLFNGSFTLSVTGRLANSPLVTHQINPGDRLFLNGATFDATTNIWYGGVIDANPAGIEIGILDPASAAVPAGQTLATAIVNISTKGGM